jgi:hypothetical protein
MKLLAMYARASRSTPAPLDQRYERVTVVRAGDSCGVCTGDTARLVIDPPGDGSRASNNRICAV